MMSLMRPGRLATTSAMFTDASCMNDYGKCFAAVCDLEAETSGESAGRQQVPHSRFYAGQNEKVFDRCFGWRQSADAAPWSFSAGADFLADCAAFAWGGMVDGCGWEGRDFGFLRGYVLQPVFADAARGALPGFSQRAG